MFGITKTTSKERAKYKPLNGVQSEKTESILIRCEPVFPEDNTDSIQAFFPKTTGLPLLKLPINKYLKKGTPKRVGILFSGAPAAGGHNVVSGIFDAIKAVNIESELIGFINGFSGLMDCEYIQIPRETIDKYRNSGGFDMLGCSQATLNTDEKLESCLSTITRLELEGLIILGGDHSTTQAAILSEYLESKTIKIPIFSVPKTINGDLTSKHIEMSAGFHSACVTYSEIIGNIATDALSAKTYFHFIKLMGRDTSHVTLECALRTHPNITLINEEIVKNGTSLKEIVAQITDVVVKRHQSGKKYGIALIPEGLIEWIPETQALIQELNSLLDEYSEGEEYLLLKLSEKSRETFLSLPKYIAEQLLKDRDIHGHVPVSKIAIDQLLSSMVREELKQNHHDVFLSFKPQTHFLGYEGRSCYPTDFDADYCYTIGYFAYHFISNKICGGYVLTIGNLSSTVDAREIVAVPMTALMHIVTKANIKTPKIKHNSLDIDSDLFKDFSEQKKNWIVEDNFISPGPFQFKGNPSLSKDSPFLLALSKK